MFLCDIQYSIKEICIYIKLFTRGGSKWGIKLETKEQLVNQVAVVLFALLMVTKQTIV